jgi:hypothetical protein
MEGIKRLKSKKFVEKWNHVVVKYSNQIKEKT